MRILEQLRFSPGIMRWSGVIVLILVAVGLNASTRDIDRSDQPRREIAAIPQVTLTPFQPVAITQTPYLPVGPTPTITSTPIPSPTPTPKPTLSVTYLRFGIDFSDTSRVIETQLMPGDTSLNAGQPIIINFTPGWPCEWINHRGCTSLHYNGQVVLTTIHSGMWGEGQELRNLLEGTWLNAASFPLDKVYANVASLPGGTARITQGKVSSGDIRVLAAVRLSASQAVDYYSLPIDDGLDLAAEMNPELADALASRIPLLIFETCGWRHPAEGYPPGSTDSSASIYLIAIGK